jgi:hypothetical protein
VVHDPTVDVSLRILAAHHAAPYVAAPLGLRWEDRDPMDRVTIVIEGLGSNELTSVSVSKGEGDGQTEKHSQNRCDPSQPITQVRDEKPLLN